MTQENDALDLFLERASRGFDAESEVLAGDDKRIERIERAVQRRYGRPVVSSALRRPVALAVACGLLMTGVAFAGAMLIAGRRKLPDRPLPTLVTAPGNAAPRPQVSVVLPRVADEPVLAPSAAVEAPLPAVAPAVPRVAAPGTAVADPSTVATPNEPSAKAFEDAPSAVTAGELFAAASRARVAGDAARSIALSQQLLSQFPSSAEATATHLSLGMLLLQQGQAARALGELETYERLAGGRGRAEALWGKAQALQRLGRSAEERAVLTELIEKYPSAAYTAAAKKRLAALQ